MHYHHHESFFHISQCSIFCISFISVSLSSHKLWPPIIFFLSLPLLLFPSIFLVFVNKHGQSRFFSPQLQCFMPAQLCVLLSYYKVCIVVTVFFLNLSSQLFSCCPVVLLSFICPVHCTSGN